MSDERGVKGTVVYKMLDHAAPSRIYVRSCDIILGVDNTGHTWQLEKQAVR